MPDGSVGAIPGWTGADSGAGDWNTAILGDVILPGIVTVEDLEVGIDIDTKKARGAECPTSTDNGLRPSKFKLRVWLNERTWPEWQTVAPSIQPRRPGRERQPLQIIHPLINHLGITEVRISGIRADQPTARGGLVFKIHCEEWFDKPKPVAKNDKPIPADLAGQATTAARDAADLTSKEARGAADRQADRDSIQRDLDRVTGKPLAPDDPVNMTDKMWDTASAGGF